jgi:hypothetical protein
VQRAATDPARIGSGASATRRSPDTTHARRRRVNSLRRMRHAAAIGCHSVDGTHLTYGPTRRLPELLGWLPEINMPDPESAAGSRAQPTA